MINLILIRKLATAENYFSASKEFRGIVHEARRLYDLHRYDQCSKELSKLPDENALIGQLIERLRGKSVYKTLKRMIEDKDVDPMIRAKGLSSLLTHVIIEMDKRPEYSLVARAVIERLNSVIYDLRERVGE